MKKIAKGKCTVLVNSCDTYSDLWDAFFKLFKDYWSDCPYDIVLNTESKTFSYPGLSIKTFSLYKEGQKVSYGKRLIEHLDRIDSEYIIILLDDFFFRKKVDTEKIEELLGFMNRDKQIVSFSFDSIDDSLNFDDGRFSHFVLRPRYCAYRFNLSGAIWEKDTFRSLIRKHESPWETEVYGTYRSFSCKKKIYTLDSNQNSPINYGKTKALDWGVVRGKWAHEDVAPLFEEHDIKVDYSVRGCLDGSEKSVKVTAPDRGIIMTIKSFGLLLYIRMIIWSLKRKIMRIFGKESNEINYLEYLRNKEIKHKKSGGR